LLAANTAALSYLAAIGAAETLIGPAAPRLDFCDLATGERWALTPGMGRVPWWIFDRRRRVPGTAARDYLAIRSLRKARPDDTVAGRLDTKGAVFRRLLQPFTVAALNTEVAAASAALLWRVLIESFGAGGAALRPLVPREGLSESFVDPACRFLAGHGAELRFGARLRRLVLDADAIRRLEFEGESVELGPADSVIMAVPPAIAARLLPGLVVPTEFRAIVNAHYRWGAGRETPLVTGLVGGTAEWVFRKPGILSVTVSAADPLVDTPAEALAPLLWHDVARALRLGEAAVPACRIVKEKRATFAASPEQLRRRPPAGTRWQNLFLAGDWTATGLPATIEGAIRAGRKAAALVDDRARKPLTQRSLQATHSHGEVADRAKV
ncbi:MAG: FAD-dependent oxidoreductase, partial [Alphaproteobacteria bacterium]|nr:FAD-dependent oxidoreductase [Alphaproteobacteria bacterium]